MKPTRTCDIEDCDRPHLAKGLCKMHYKRAAKHGDPMRTPLAPVEGCSVEGCIRPHKARGWCAAHYRQWLRFGDPLVLHKPGRAAGDGHHLLAQDPGYENAHGRIRRRKGPAKLQACAHCGEPAHDWAYDHEDPEERYDAVKKMIFSLDPDHYIPLCRTCHQRFDRPHRPSEATS